MMLWKSDLCLRLLTLGFGLLAVTEIVVSDESKKFKEQTAIVGTSYKMKCTRQQEPTFTPSISHATITIWSVNGSLPRGPKYKLLTDGMVIRNVSTEDMFANYTCTVLDRVSFTPLYSENIKLKLRQREGKSFQSNALIGEATEQHTKNVWGILNQWVKLQCNVLSRPRPTFTWRKQQNEEKIENVSNVYKIMEGEFTSNLTIFIHNETMFGKYICEASNDHGSFIQYFIVTEGYRPKSPFMYPVFISKDKLTLKVEPQETLMTGVAASPPKEKLPATSYIIQYAEAEGLSIASGQANKDNVHTRNKKWITVRHSVPVHEISPYSKRDGGIFEVRNLKENTTYLVRSAVANDAAISEFSPALRITTEASRQNVTASSTTMKVEEEDKIATKNRENFGRSSNYQPELENMSSSSPVLISNTTQPINSNGTTDCKTFRFKKTIIKSITTTTLIQDLDALSYNNAAENSSLVKKLVEENTSIDRMYLCSI